MTEKHEIYKCDICGNTIEILFNGEGELVCCGEPMNLMPEITEGEKQDAHIPVFEKIENGELIVKVGKNPHPMTDEHYIKMIEVIDNNHDNHKFLTPDQLAEFKLNTESDKQYARAYCNMHGLWKGENNIS